MSLTLTGSPETHGPLLRRRFFRRPTSSRRSSSSASGSPCSCQRWSRPAAGSRFFGDPQWLPDSSRVFRLGQGCIPRAGNRLGNRLPAPERPGYDAVLPLEAPMSLRFAVHGACPFFLATVAAAQLAQPGQPASARHPRLVVDDVPIYVLPRPDVERLLSEDEARNNWPARYGAVIPVGFSSDDAGRWDDVPSGELVWRLRLVSPGARSLGLLFDRYELPASGKLFVHGKRDGTVLGAFTRATRQPNGMLAIQPVLGDELTLEYVQDAGDPGVPALRLGEVIHDYRGILDALFFENPVELLGGGCLVDVNCPIGSHYRDIKRAVLFVLFSGSYCSAGLLNNTAADGTPYFLTADHCGDMTNGVVVFGYENPGCGVGGATQANSISGATLLAASSRWDSQLYLLSAPPPRSFMPFF